MRDSIKFSVACFAIACATACASGGTDLRDAPPAAIAEQLEKTQADKEGESVDVSVDGSVDTYIAIALDRQPGLAAHAERWRAATHRADAATAWPRLMLSYAFLPLPIETRLGPQRHRVGLRQGIPWPGQRDSAAQAAAAQASVEEMRLAATANQIREEVELAYWDLWSLRQRGRILSQQVTILETSARIARGGVEVGNQGLSSVARIELAAARLRDRQAGNTARIAASEARLRGALGVDPGPIPTAPGEWNPAEINDVDTADAPEIMALRKKVDAAAKQAEAADATTRPTFTVGLDYIFVNEGDAMADNAGRDSLMLMLGIALPTLWSAEAARADAAHASKRAAEFSVSDAAIDRAANADALLELARDARRRFEFYRDTLLPQAENAFEASLGDYESGRATVADLLLAQREWLELSIQSVDARADYERAVARLARLAGQKLTTRNGGLDE